MRTKTCWSDEDENAENNVRRGHQIFFKSSMKQNVKAAQEVALEATLHDQLIGHDDGLPDHRMRYQCAEPGLISEHRSSNA